MRILPFLFLLVFSHKGFAQLNDTLFSGIYYGYNLYVLNPLTPVGDYSVQTVTVNGRPGKDQLRSAAFELDLSLLEQEYGKPVHILMSYHSDYPPVVVNPEDLLPPDDFRFENTNSRRGKLFWRISGRSGTSPFVVEQYRWNKWVKLLEVDVSDTLEAGLYSIDLEPHSGLNMYRIRKIDPRGQVVFSKDEKYRAAEQPEIFIADSKDNNELMFTHETLYEIYSANGKLLKRGKEKYVDISDLPRGRYFVNYDNKTEVFGKK